MMKCFITTDFAYNDRFYLGCTMLVRKRISIPLK